MNYQEAKAIVEKKKYLVGQTIKGETIDEIIVCPSKQEHFQLFEKMYFQTLSADYAISQFENEDVEVAVIIGKKRLKERVLIEWKTIEWAETNLDKKAPNR